MTKKRKFLGSGSYCNVYLCKNGEVKKVFRSEADFSSVLRETSILQVMQVCPHVVRFKRIEIDDDEPTIVMEHCEKGCLVPNKYVQDMKGRKVVIRDLLRAIHCMHERGFMHRDIKPPNILVCGDDSVRLTDFNVSTYQGIHILDKTVKYSLAPGTLWWRAPESFLDDEHYNLLVDVWSLGVVYLEMVLGNVKFLEGDSEIDQMFKCFRLLGSPGHHGIWSEAREMKYWKETYPVWSRGSVHSMLEAVDPLERDFILSMIAWPDRRSHTEKLLRHPFLSV